MAFWNRRHEPVDGDDLGNVHPAKTAAPDGAKSVIITEDVRNLVNEWGWPTASAYGMLYRRQPAVRTVVDFLARNIAQLTLKTYERLDNADRRELDRHPLAVLLRKPNPQTSRYRFMRDTVADKAIYDRAYWRLDRPRFPDALQRVPPDRIMRERNPNTNRVTYKGPDGKNVPRNELIIFSGYSPEGAWDDEDGVAPLETLRRILAEEWAAQDHRRNFWRNAARHAGVIERPLEAPEWQDGGRQRFRADWENTMAGGMNAGRTIILEEGMTWNPAAFSPKESEYIAGRQLMFEEVARAYGIAPKLFGMGDIANANIEAFHKQLYQDTLGPWLKELQDDIELQLLPVVENSDDDTAARIYVEFNIQAKLDGSFEEQSRTLVTTTGVPVVGVNEARARLNLPRIDDDAYDVPVKPLNVLYGGQPAPTIPTEVPQPGTRGARPDRKAAPPPSVLRRRGEAAAHHTELFRRYFRAQRQAVEKKAAAFDMERWNGKLTGELYTARVALARKTGRLAAGQIDGVYDEAQTLNFLQESARREAEAVNAKTAAALDAADDTALVFDIALSSRAERLGLSTATAIIGFARAEAAKQSVAADGRQRTKTWVVTSSKSRHPAMDGETVNFDETFSNGAQWPGDSSLGDVDEVAGCMCLLELN